MQLDWVEQTRSFVLRVQRREADIQTIMREHGLDFSLPASTEETAVLFTHEPFAAVAWADYATDRARAELKGIIHEIDTSWAPSSDRHVQVPYDRELWAFQKADIDYALKRKHCLIGDQPGLGKTPIAIAYANEIDAKRVLCIVPASIREQWIKRIREWTTMRWPYIIHPIFNGRNGTHPHAQWTVVSYDLARSEAIWKALAKGTYDLLILDEAHFLKTIDTRRTRSVFGGGQSLVADPLCERADRILALTGTPLPNRPREAYTLARGLCWDAIDWMSEDRFRHRFNPSVKGVTAEGRIFVDERTGRFSELQSRLRASFMARHLKRDVMPQLKMPVYDIIELEATAAVKQALQAESLLDFDPDKYDAHLEVLGQTSTVRREMGLALAPQVADYIDMLIDGGEDRLLIAYHHTEVGNILEKAWQRHGVLRWHAGQSKRNEAKKELYIQNPRYKIAMGQIQTIGTGVDGLQDVCSHALIAEPDWTPGTNIQFFDRLDRGLQARTVQGDIFVAPGSIAEKVLAKALQKLHTTHKALDRRT